jgi:hypothetical protein
VPQSPTNDEKKRVAILQPNYLPWKGYFDLIASVDELVIYETVQFTRRDWRNRNLIKTPQGPHWLTVPVSSKGKRHQTISQVRIHGTDWAINHWKALSQNYRRAKFFGEVAAWLQPLYLDRSYSHISELNKTLIVAVCGYLNIRTIITSSIDYSSKGERSIRLAEICEQTGAKVYVSGPSARIYVDEKAFSDRGIEISWFDYLGYKEYPQLWGPFVHNLTILDLLFNCGRESARYMRYVV